MNNSKKQFFLHLLVFIVIEVIFVLLLFREIPETNLFTLMGILHTSYWGVLLLAGWMREKLHQVRQKFFATYLPVVYHVIIHIRVSYEAMDEHTEEHHYDEHSMLRILIGAAVLGILIFAGEYILHRKIHCDTHHADAHRHCHDGECEVKH